MRVQKVLGLLEYQRRTFGLLFLLALGIGLFLAFFSMRVALEDSRRDAQHSSDLLRREVRSLLDSRREALDLFETCGGAGRGLEPFFLKFFNFIGRTDRQCRVEHVHAGPNLKGIPLNSALLDGTWHLSPLFSFTGSLSLVAASARTGGYLVGALPIPEILLTGAGEDVRGFWGIVASTGGVVFSAQNDRGLFPPGSVVPRDFLGFEEYERTRIAGWPVEALVQEIVPGLV